MLIGDRDQPKLQKTGPHTRFTSRRQASANSSGRLTGQPAWKALMAPHQQVHRCGIEAAKAFATGDLDRATHLVSEAAEASHEVMRLLNELSDIVMVCIVDQRGSI